MSFEDHGCFGIFVAFVVCQLLNCAYGKIGGGRYAKCKLKRFDLIILTPDALVTRDCFHARTYRYIFFISVDIENICIRGIGIDGRIMDLE